MNTQRKDNQLTTALITHNLDKISLFGALSSEQLDKLLRDAEIRQCHAGDHIFAAGDLPSDIFVVLEGRVDIVVEQDNIHKIQSTLREGDCFGETAVIGIQKQVGTAIASAKEVTLLVISPTLLLNIQQADCECFAILMMNIARDVSRKLHHQL